eukprot:gnl/Hemi2/7515_TR2576_c0_g10_i1.p1 gnl/Hemi2/7515_TR2576_c0_g10~~gnl/Hemi2/7515_TR2576_c0_g10_i1.p1  ORF type:complete len:222 (-),score=93.33 gnl/Hemi2/7515_TR2576_c0_g10_i1:71-736(-)
MRSLLAVALVAAVLAVVAMADDGPSMQPEARVCSLSEEFDVACVLAARQQRNLCACSWKFDVSNLLSPALPVAGTPRWPVRCDACTAAAVDAFCHQYLSEMGCMECKDKCVSFMGKRVPFAQEADQGRYYLTFSGVDGCAPQLTSAAEQRMLAHLPASRPVVAGPTVASLSSPTVAIAQTQLSNVAAQVVDAVPQVISEAAEAMHKSYDAAGNYATVGGSK